MLVITHKHARFTSNEHYDLLSSPPIINLHPSSLLIWDYTLYFLRIRLVTNAEKRSSFYSAHPSDIDILPCPCRVLFYSFFLFCFVGYSMWLYARTRSLVFPHFFIIHRTLPYPHSHNNPVSFLLEGLLDDHDPRDPSHDSGVQPLVISFAYILLHLLFLYVTIEHI